MCKCKHNFIKIWELSIVYIDKCSNCNSYWLGNVTGREKIKLNEEEALKIIECFKKYNPIGEKD